MFSTDLLDVIELSTADEPPAILVVSDIFGVVLDTSVHIFVFIVVVSVDV